MRLRLLVCVFFMIFTLIGFYMYSSLSINTGLLLAISSGVLACFIVILIPKTIFDIVIPSKDGTGGDKSIAGFSLIMDSFKALLTDIKIIMKSLSVREWVILIIAIIIYIIYLCINPVIIYMNTMEWVMLIATALLMWTLFSHLLKSKKKAVIAVLLFMPALFISLHGATQVLTADEPQYIKSFSNMPSSLYRTSYKGLSQYRTTQMFLGNLFNLLRVLGFTEDLIYAPPNQNLFHQVYKMAHWFLCASFLTGILYIVWKWYLPYKLKNQRLLSPVILGTIGVMFFSLPVNALMLKVANYDASACFPSVLGILLAGVYISHGKKIHAVAATFFALLGVIEKTSSAPWYLVSITLVTFGVLLHNQQLGWVSRFMRAAFTLASHIVASAFISAFNLKNIMLNVPNEEWVIRGVEFSMTRSVAAITRIISFVNKHYVRFGNNSVLDTSFQLISLILLFTISLTVAFILYGGYSLVVNKPSFSKRIHYIIPRIISILLAVVLTTAIIGTYTISVMNARYYPIEPGFYEPTSDLSGSVAHYGARTYWNHMFLQLIFFASRNIVNFPTPIIILFIILIFLFFIYSLSVTLPRQFYFLTATLLCCTILPIVFSLGGQPGSGRYDGITTNLCIISAFVLGCYYLDDSIVIKTNSSYIPVKFINHKVLVSFAL